MIRDLIMFDGWSMSDRICVLVLKSNRGGIYSDEGKVERDCRERGEGGHCLKRGQIVQSVLIQSPSR